MRRVVVLPQPEGPRREKNSPSATVKSMSSTATTSPKRLVTPRSSTAVVVSLTVRRSPLLMPRVLNGYQHSSDSVANAQDGNRFHLAVHRPQPILLSSDATPAGTTPN